MATAWICVIAVLLDSLLGEPRRAHPLAAFGRLAERLEQGWNRDGQGSVASGAAAIAMLVGIPVLLAVAVTLWLPVEVLIPLQILCLWLALGAHSLTEHARAVIQPLAAGDLAGARAAVARLVSRDPEAMDERAIARATTESVLENGADAVFASLFWFLLAGLPGLVAHRLINTLDAMWGYRTPRFEYFGKAAARLDDTLGWIPARLTALSYGLVGNWQRARQCRRYQARHWSSPNAGVVMASGAGALGVTLGGDAVYADGVHQRPRLGGGGAPDAGSIRDALALVQRALTLWLVLIVLGGLWS